MKIRFLGTHNTVSKQTRHTCFLVDGTLAVDAGSIASALTLDEQAKIEAVLLSHGHYDHIKELPALAFNNAPSGRVIKVFGPRETLQIFSTHLADGRIYPDFIHGDSHFQRTVLEMCKVNTLQPFDVGGYRVSAVQVPHSASAVGYEISKDGRSVFYTGDTGPGLHGVWKHTSPNLLISELTLPNRLKENALASGHLCAELLMVEMEEFQRENGYLPRVSLVHVSPQFRVEIERDVREVFQDLPLEISLAAEDEEVVV